MAQYTIMPLDEGTQDAVALATGYIAGKLEEAGVECAESVSVDDFVLIASLPFLRHKVAITVRVAKEEF